MFFKTDSSCKLGCLYNWYAWGNPCYYKKIPFQMALKISSWQDEMINYSSRCYQWKAIIILGINNSKNYFHYLCYLHWIIVIMLSFRPGSCSYSLANSVSIYRSIICIKACIANFIYMALCTCKLHVIVVHNRILYNYYKIYVESS